MTLTLVNNTLPCFRKYTAYIFLSVLLLLFLSPAKGQVSVSFGSDKGGGCPPFTVQFNSMVSGTSGSAVYHWDFGNGNSSDLRNPASVYTATGTYKVTLTVTDGGRTHSYSKDITGYKNPVADFSVLEEKACIPAEIHFKSNSSAGSGTLQKFYWDFGDGNTREVYSEETSHTYMSLMKPSATLTVTNSYGCYSSISKNEIAEILPSMYASFTASKEVLCKVSDGVQFTNNSSGPGTLSYTWDFGDGNTSTAKAPSHSFNKKGIYTVSLTVKNNDGCSITHTQANYLNVASYKASFSLPALACQGQQVYLSTTSTPYPSSTRWYIDKQPAYYGYNSFSHSFPDTGKHTIQLINTFGTCPDTASGTITVRPTPQLNGFIADMQDLCGAPTTIKFKDTTSGVTQWNWNFGINYPPASSSVQAPSYTYASDGNYWTSLTVSNVYGCAASASRYINIRHPSVTISRTSNSNDAYCGYQKVRMLVNSSSDAIRDYKWVFSNGFTSTEQSPEYEFTLPGNYSVYLEYTTQEGCKGRSNSVPITVYGKPKADFTSPRGTNICGNTPVTFNYTGGTSYTTLHWTFEGDYSTTGNPQTIRYNSSGSFGVKLIVQNGNCSDTIEKQDYIKVVPPFPKIAGYKDTCGGTRGKVEFTQTSKDAESWKWEWGDGKSETVSSDQPTITHEYSATGTYKVVLITSNGACTLRDSISVPVFLKQNPKLSLSKTSFCPDETIPFSITNYEKVPTYTTGYYQLHSLQKWEYDDGTNFKGRASIDYDTYFITSAVGKLYPDEIKDGKLRVITASYQFRCPDTSNYVPVQLKGAFAAFTIEKDKQCLPNAVVLKDASVANNNSITRWSWNFGDGQTQTMTQSGTVSHTYTTPGSYNVTLTITDAGGCNSSTKPYTTNVEVYGPKANFGLSGTNVPLNSTINFYNYTNAYGSSNTQYKWDFGDGTFGNGYHETHTYPYAGIYTVKLTATDPVTGCTSEAPPQTIIVRYFNTAFQYNTSFITGTDCAPVVANFVNTSYGYTSFTWDFGDGFTLDNVHAPSHVYKDPGTYIVTLFVKGYNNLTGEFKDTITIAQPEAVLKATPRQLCLGETVDLKASGGNISKYIWDFGDGNILTSSDSSLSHVYNRPGTFKPQLLVTGNKGCTRAATANDRITVRANPVVNITPADPHLCLGQSLQLKATGGVSYTWKAANGITDLTIPNPVVKPDITTTYHLQVKDDIGCTTESSYTVHVVQKEPLDKMNDMGMCYGEAVQLQASGSSKYQWINETGGLSGTQIPNPVARPAQTVRYTVVGSDNYNCFADTASIEVAVHPLPTVRSGNDTAIQAGESIQLQASGSPDIVNWQWQPADHSLSCINCASPMVTPLGSTAYTVRARTIHGCSATDVTTVKVLCEANTVYIPNAFTPNGDKLNDRFILYGIGMVKHLVIFDRYGKKVFEKRNFFGRDPASAWDGTLNGKLLATGTFVYYAEMECETGGPFMLKGTVTLIR